MAGGYLWTVTGSRFIRDDGGDLIAGPAVARLIDPDDGRLRALAFPMTLRDGGGGALAIVGPLKFESVRLHSVTMHDPRHTVVRALVVPFRI